MEEKRFLTIHDASRLWHIEAEELRRRCAEGSRALPRGWQSGDKVRFREKYRLSEERWLFDSLKPRRVASAGLLSIGKRIRQAF